MVYMTETKTCRCGRTFYNTDCIRFECDVCSEDWKVSEELSKLYCKTEEEIKSFLLGWRMARFSRKTK